jgi:hypothetical protein
LDGLAKSTRHLQSGFPARTASGMTFREIIRRAAVTGEKTLFI